MLNQKLILQLNYLYRSYSNFQIENFQIISYGSLLNSFQIFLLEKYVVPYSWNMNFIPDLMRQPGYELPKAVIVATSPLQH
jgi:hypothetical protein